MTAGPKTPETNRRKAIDLARQALQVAENDPGILANAALVLAHFGEDIGAMIGLVDRALALNPSFARGWYLSGVLRIWAGQHDLAIEHVETSLRLSPRERMGQPLYVMGTAYFFKRQFDEAASKLLLAIQDHPGSPRLIPHSRRVLCPYGAARRSARDRRPAARHHPSGRAERSAFPQPRGPRALPVGPAAGGGRDDMTQTRRLAAILAADVAGYSRLIGADEEGTLDRLKAIRAELIDPKIAEHRGRIVKTTGDGLLVEFASVVDALRCATEWQRGMAERNAASPADRSHRIPDRHQRRRYRRRGRRHLRRRRECRGAARRLGRAGRHLRLRSRSGGRCAAGSISPSRIWASRALKNIARPVRVYRVRLAATRKRATTASTMHPPLALPDKPSIAVLPFQNMSGDPEQEYFADGMVEEIITALSRIRWLFVIARNSSFTYKGQAVDVKQVGRELGVRYVLEGSVRKGGNRVRITAQLIDARNRRASLGRPLRRLARRRVRSSGQGGVERRRRHRAGIAGCRDRPFGRPPDQRSDRLRPLSARLCDGLVVGKANPRGAPSYGAGDRARSALRAGARLGRVLLFSAAY